MTLARISPLIIQRPDLWATRPKGGYAISLYRPICHWEPHNEPTLLLGERYVKWVSPSYPETYRLTFTKPTYETEDNAYLDGGGAFDINGVRFRIDHWDESDIEINYEAIGWPVSTSTGPAYDLTPCFPGWEDVGREHLDEGYYD